MVEDTEAESVSEKGEEESVRVRAKVKAGADVRPIGVDIKEGEVGLCVYMDVCECVPYMG